MKTKSNSIFRLVSRLELAGDVLKTATKLWWTDGWGD